MQEQLVSFKTAKLAKEKGYIDMSYPVYSYDGFKILSYTNSMNIYPCPTQSLLQKWLREKYCIHIEIIWVDTLSDIYVYHISTTNNAIRPDSIFYHSYEEALETGLQEALKLI